MLSEEGGGEVAGVVVFVCDLEGEAEAGAAGCECGAGGERATDLFSSGVMVSSGHAAKTVRVRAAHCLRRSSMAGGKVDCHFGTWVGGVVLVWQEALGQHGDGAEEADVVGSSVAPCQTHSSSKSM